MLNSFQFEEVDEALYHCNWITMPHKMQKLILIYKIRCMRPVNIHCEPFFVFNSEQLVDVCVHRSDLFSGFLIRIIISAAQAVVLPADGSLGLASISESCLSGK